MSQSCYYPNGELSPNDYPCNSSLPNSPCCAQDDACLEDTYCFDNSNNLIYRKSCTDSTWKDYMCPTLCHDVDNGTTALVVPAQLDPITWCCNGYNNNTGECFSPSEGSNQPWVRKRGAIITDRTTGATGPLGVALNLSSAPAPAPAGNNASAGGMCVAGPAATVVESRVDRHGEVLVGATVGSVLGAALLCVVVALVWQVRKAGRERRAYEEERQALFERIEAANNTRAANVVSEKYGGEVHFLNGTPMAELGTYPRGG